MIYVASPYSSTIPDEEHSRYYTVSGVVAILMKQGLPVFSPIVHCHEIACDYKLPKDAKFWQGYNTAFLRMAEAMYIVCLPGWEESLGVRQEAKLAWSLNIPVYLVGTTGLISTTPFKAFLT